MRRRINPEHNAIQHAVEAKDQTTMLKAKYINPVKGRGVFTIAPFQKGEFVVEYRGELIHTTEAQRRRKVYRKACSVFIFDFRWSEKIWSIDASREDGSMGRLVNDDHVSPNCKMKKLTADGKPHLCLFALRDINIGEEISYDYGGSEWPWRNKFSDEPAALPVAMEMKDSASTWTVKETIEGPSDLQRSDDPAALPVAMEMKDSASTWTVKETIEGPSDLQRSDDPAALPVAMEMKDSASTLTVKETIEGPSDLQRSDDPAALPVAMEMKDSASTLTVKETIEGPSDLQRSDDPAALPVAMEMKDSASTWTVKETIEGPSDLQRSDDPAALPVAMEMKDSASTWTVKETIEGPSDLQRSDDPAALPVAMEMKDSASTWTVKETIEGPSDLQRSDDPAALPVAMEMKDSASTWTVKETIEGPSDLQVENVKPQTRNRINPVLVNYTDSDESDNFCPSPIQYCSYMDSSTTGIEMNKISEGSDRSDELFYSTPDSEEEYVPETSEDDSGCSDNSSIDFQLQNRTGINEKDTDSLLPPRQDSWSGLSQPRKGRGRNKDSPLKKSNCTEINVTDTFQEVESLSVSVSAVRKHENGSRMYTKKQYCLFCNLPFIKMARHLERKHCGEPEVARLRDYPKGSKERRMQIEYLRNKGNFAHNAEVFKTGDGELVPRKQPKKDSKGQDFLHCKFCQGLFARKLLWRHIRSCKFIPSAKPKPGKTRVQALCSLTTPAPPHIKEDLWKLLNNMTQDKVYAAVKNDKHIIELGEHLYKRLGHDPSKHEYIRQKLRELGRLLICSREVTSLKTIKEHILPENFMHVVHAVQQLAGHNSETNTYKCPSLALKIGHSLTKISLLIESSANIERDWATAKDTCSFRKIYQARWHELIASSSRRTLEEARWNSPQLLPFTEDVKILHSFLEEKQQMYKHELSNTSSSEAWAKLSKVTLAQVILFNRRRGGEVSKMPVASYTSRDLSEPHEDINQALSELEKKLCQHFQRIEIRGKRGRKVPCLLTPSMQDALDLLVKKRNECGVLKENVYMFARPSAMSYYRGSDCLRDFAHACGAKNPETLSSTKLRKQIGTLSKVLNLSNTEMDQLADFLGHDIRVHRQFYRLPEGTLQIAKISKIFMALEKGRLAEFQGKSLDDIDIDPEEEVEVDSDMNEECESEKVEVDSDMNECESGLRDTGLPKKECQIKSKQSHKPFKRQAWIKEEIHAVEKHMMRFITSCRVPGKMECVKCLKAEPALHNRNWSAVKFYIKNRITALKRKVECEN